MKKKALNKTSKIDYIDVLLFIAPFITGLISIWSLSLFSVLCIIGIIYKVIKNKKIYLPTGKNIIFLCIYIFSFLIVEFYAVDKGMNILAFLKNFTIILFLITYLQFNNKENENNEIHIKNRLRLLPLSACCTVILSLFLTIDSSSGMFVDNRLQGIWNYANSYGLFLMLGVWTLINKEKFSVKDYVMFIILFIGIILTNSRAIILLTFLAIIVSIWTNKVNRKTIIISLLCFVLLFGGVYVFSKMEKRVNKDMLQSSEFITRLLYYTDGIKMIKENPFGYGYDGWYYKQTEIQTGVYDTKYVHNSVLQVLLDVGVIPTIALICMLGFTFFSKRQDTFSRILMLLILGHSLIDIDLEYILFVLILMMIIDFKTKEFEIKKSKYYFTVVLSILCIWYFVIFISDAEFALKNYKNAIDIIPFHTEAMQEILYSTANQSEQLKYADKVLKLNKNVSGAYEAIRNDFVSKNEYIKAVEAEEKRLKLNRYTLYNYLTYAKLLSDSIDYFDKNSKNEEKIIMLQKVVNIENIIDEVLQNTNPLCYKTIHTPNLELPDELKDFINQAKLLQTH